MTDIFSLSIVIHVFAGFVALFTLWIPLFVKKGGRYHRLTGWIFTISMFIISVTSIHLALYRIFIDGNRVNEQFSFSLFMIFIAILSFATAYYGLRVLKFKTHKGNHHKTIDWLVSLLLLLSALAMSIYGFTYNDLLLAWFPFLGIFIASTQMFYWWRGSKFRRSWVVEHITGMLSCGISTVTAFVVLGAPRLFSLEEAPLWLWFAPTVILVPLIVYFTTLEYRKAARKRSAKKAAL